MNFKENIRIAAYSIRTNLLRSLLTMLGIIIGVFSVIAIITVGNGGRDYIVGMIRDMGQSLVSIQVAPRTDVGQHINRRDIQNIKAMEHVRYATPHITLFGSGSTRHANGFLIAGAGTPDMQHTMVWELVDGYYFTEEEYTSGARVALMPRMSAETMFGTTNVLGEFIDFTLNEQTVRLRIVGLLDVRGGLLGGGDGDQISGMLDSVGMGDMGEGMAIIIMPLTIADQMRSNSGAYENINIIADDERNLDAVGNAAVNQLYINHGNAGSGVYQATNMATYIDLLDSVINILTTFIAGVSAISLMVGGIGVMNIMLVSVTERTREIGIRKALGAKTGTIMFQFLTESVILCLIGGTIGFILGVAGAAIVAYYMSIPIAMRLSTIAIAVGFSSAIGIFFGIYPARRAAKMLPIDALRRE